MSRRPINFHLSRGDQKVIREILHAGIQQVRVVLRAIALEQLTVGQTAPVVAKIVHLSPQPFGGSPIDTSRADWSRLSMSVGDEARRSFWIFRKNSGSSPWCAVILPWDWRAGRCA